MYNIENTKIENIDNLYYILLKAKIIDDEYLQRKCPLFSVVEEFSGLFTHPSIF